MIRNSVSKGSARSAILAIILVCGGGDIALASSQATELTMKDAASLAALTVCHQIAGLKHKGSFSITEFNPEPDERFYTFEALGVWSPQPGSAVIGHYSVDKSSGAVWDLFPCKEVKFEALRILREKYLHRLNLIDRRKSKPADRSAVPVFCAF